MRSNRTITKGGVLVMLVTLAVILGTGGCGDEKSPTTGGGGGGTSFVFFNPVVTTSVGDWVRYELENGDEATWEVVEVNPMTHLIRVTMETRSRESKKIVSNLTHPVKPNDFFLWGATAGMVVARVHVDRVIEMSRSFDSLSVVLVGGMQGEVQSWYSQEVPVMGLIRRTALGGGGKRSRTERIVMKLVAMGRAKPQ